MNRGQIRTIVRERVKDTNSDEWTDAQVNAEINLAAQYCAISLAQNTKMPFGRSSFDISGGDGKVYPLYDVLDWHSFVTDGVDRRARWIMEAEASNRRRSAIGRDQDTGALLFFMRPLPDYHARITITGATTGTWKFTYRTVDSSALNHNATVAQVQAAFDGHANIGSGNFLVSGKEGEYYDVKAQASLAGLRLSAITVSGIAGFDGTVAIRPYVYEAVFLCDLETMDPPMVFVYNRAVPSIADGADGDTYGFGNIPEHYDELIISTTVDRLLGHDGSSTHGYAVAHAGRMEQMSNMDSAKRGDPKKIKG